MALTEPSIPAEGTEVRLTNGFGEDPGALPAGALGTVVAVHDPGTPGVGHDGENPTVQIALADDPHGRHVFFPLTFFRDLWELVEKKVTKNAR